MADEYWIEFEVRIQENGRLRIPKDIRDRYNIIDGNRYRIQIQVVD